MLQYAFCVYCLFVIAVAAVFCSHIVIIYISLSGAHVVSEYKITLPVHYLLSFVSLCSTYSRIYCCCSCCVFFNTLRIALVVVGNAVVIVVINLIGVDVVVDVVIVV